jgi:hypothetical protein
VLLINVAVVWYLVLELRRCREPERELAFQNETKTPAIRFLE